MRRLFWIIALLFVIQNVGRSDRLDATRPGRTPGAADTVRTLPPPRWTVVLETQPIAYPRYVHVNAVGPVLLISHDTTVIALKRASGRELWRRAESVEKQTIAPAAPTNPPSDFPAARAAVGKTERHIQTYWQLMASGVIAPYGPVAFLLETQTIIDPDSSRPNGERHTETHNEVAVQVMTGQTLWRTALQDLNRITTLQGDLLLLDTQGNLRDYSLKTILPVAPH